MRGVLILLGLSPQGGNYETVRRRIATLGLDASHLRKAAKGRRLRDCTDAELAEAVRNSRSFAQVLALLGIRSGGDRTRLGARIQRAEIDMSHFSGQGWRRGSTAPVIPGRSLEEILAVGRLVPTSYLRKRLIAEEFRDPRCGVCGRYNWNGKPIPLELDHVNGRRDDNQLTNLRLLCPNCHAQTSTYRGRNIGSESLS
jgi:hypothetical protein